MPLKKKLIDFFKKKSKSNIGDIQFKQIEYTDDDNIKQKALVPNDYEDENDDYLITRLKDSESLFSDDDDTESFIDKYTDSPSEDQEDTNSISESEEDITPAGRRLLAFLKKPKSEESEEDKEELSDEDKEKIASEKFRTKAQIHYVLKKLTKLYPEELIQTNDDDFSIEEYLPKD